MIVKLTGGLGNQLFQYAHARSKALRENLPLQFCLGDDMGASGFALDRYDIDVPIVNAEPTEPFGWYQSEDCFLPWVIRAAIRKPKHLSADTLAWGERFRREGDDAVFVHCRRSDNVGSPTHVDLTATAYFDRALRHVRRQIRTPIFFIFSDDPDWCEDNLRPMPGFIVRTNQAKGREHEDIWLMSQCRHAIIANSSFSWWGAWLGERAGAVTVAPKEWYVPGCGLDDKGIVPERWTRL